MRALDRALWQYSKEIKKWELTTENILNTA